MSDFVDGYFKWIRKTFPVNAKGTAVGLDAGGPACKAVEIVRHNDHFELLRWVIDPVVNGDEKAVLVRTFEAFGLQTRASLIVSAVGGKGTLVRYVDMPRMAVSDLKKTFAIEADKYFPFPKDTVFTDCYVLETSEQARKMLVLVAAVKKEMVEARMKLFKEAGIDPVSLTLRPAAVANVFAALPPDGFAPGAFKTCAVVDIGEESTNLMILSGGIPRFNRDIFIGVQEIFTRVSNLSGLPAAEALARLTSGSDTDGSVRRSVDAAMANLMAEVRMSFDYFITEKNLAVSCIFPVGEGAVVPGVIEALQAGFDIPVGRWDPVASLASGPSVTKPGVDSLRLVTALGLALNEYD